MNEGINTGPSPEELAKQEELKRRAEEDAYYEALWAEESAPKKTTPEDEAEIQNFENLVADFKRKHSLEELHAIEEISPDLYDAFLYTFDIANPDKTEKSLKPYTKEYAEKYRANVARAKLIILSPEDQVLYGRRMNAKRDLDDIVISFDKIIKMNITQEKLGEIKLKKQKLARAVGMTNKNKINHDR